MRVLIASFAFAFSAGSAFAADVDVSSKIESVTVFPSGAEIVRALTVKLGAGDQSIVTAITGQALAPSIRVEGSGSGGLEIGSVDTRTVNIPAEDPTIAQSARKAIEDEIEKLRDQKATLDDTISVAKLQQSYLQSLAALPSQGTKATQPAQEDWGALFAMIGDRMSGAVKTITEAKLKERALDRAIVEFQKKLPSAAVRVENKTELRINVTAREPMEATLKVRYQVNGAFWNPFYDARLGTGDGSAGAPPKLTLARRASITQTTGEDWRDVKLALSTTRPGTATAAPDLDMLRVDFQPEVPPVTVGSAPEAAAVKTRGLPAAASVPTNSIAPPMEALPPRPVQETQAVTTVMAFQAVYAIAGETTIPSLAEAKRLLIGIEDLDTELFVKSVPRLDPTAYLYATLTLPRTSSPTLPGTIVLFRDSVYAGTGALPQLAPGEPFELGFGADERVKVRQVVVEDKKGEEGTFSKSQIEQRSYAITVKNLHARPIDVHLTDRSPVPAHQDITVEVSVTAGPQPTRNEAENKRGLLYWTLKAAPDQETRIAYGYKVSAPAGKTIRYSHLGDEKIQAEQTFRFGAATKF